MEKYNYLEAVTADAKQSGMQKRSYIGADMCHSNGIASPTRREQKKRQTICRRAKKPVARR